MADLIGLLRVGTPLPMPATGWSPGPVTPATAIPAVEPSGGSASGGQATDQFHAFRRQPAPVSWERPPLGGAQRGSAAIVEPRPPLDPDMLTGPPPAFSASLLELQSHLRISLARIEAARHIGQGEPAGIAHAPAAAQEASRTGQGGLGEWRGLRGAKSGIEAPEPEQAGIPVPGPGRESPSPAADSAAEPGPDGSADVDGDLPQTHPAVRS